MADTVKTSVSKEAAFDLCKNKVADMVLNYMNRTTDDYQNEKNAAPFDRHDIVVGGSFGVAYSLFNDFFLVPMKRPAIQAPTVKTNFVEVPGLDGAIDFSEVINGVTYNRIEGSWDFMFLHNKARGVGYAWSDIYWKLIEQINGYNCALVLLKDRYYLDFAGARSTSGGASVTHDVYYGRLTVDKWSSDSSYSTVTIKYNLEPQRYGMINVASDDWKTGHWSMKDPTVLIPSDPTQIDEPAPGEDPIPSLPGTDVSYSNTYYQGTMVYAVSTTISNNTNGVLVFAVHPLEVNAEEGPDTWLNEVGETTDAPNYSVDTSGKTKYNLSGIDTSLDDDWLRLNVIGYLNAAGVKNTDDYDSPAKIIFAHRTNFDETKEKGGLVTSPYIYHGPGEQGGVSDVTVQMSDGSNLRIYKYNEGSEPFYAYAPNGHQLTFRDLASYVNGYYFRFFDSKVVNGITKSPGDVYKELYGLSSATKVITPTTYHDCMYVRVSDVPFRLGFGETLTGYTSYHSIWMESGLYAINNQRVYTMPYNSKIKNALDKYFKSYKEKEGNKTVTKWPPVYISLDINYRTANDNIADSVIMGFDPSIGPIPWNDIVLPITPNLDNTFKCINADASDMSAKQFKIDILGMNYTKANGWTNPKKGVQGGKYGFVLDPVNKQAQAFLLEKADDKLSSLTQVDHRFATFVGFMEEIPNTSS